MLGEALAVLIEGRTLPPAQMRAAMQAIMSGRCSHVQVAAFLTALRVRGETADELTAAVEVLREEMVPLDVGELTALDTCGTGGDELHTFNISTAAAIVTAACGVPVVKHGNRGVSSTSGSADVLVALGVHIDLDPPQVRRCLEQVGMAFCFAPRFHPAMRHVASVRKELGFRTLFNLLGPLCNPARAPHQLLGVGRRELLDLLAVTVSQLGIQRAYLVHGQDGLDEVTLGATTDARLVQDGRVEVLQWTPADFGLDSCPLAELQVEGPEGSAARIRAILQGQSSPAADVVMANAAVALLAAGRVSDLRTGVARADEALREGRARHVLERLKAISNAVGARKEA